MKTTMERVDEILTRLVGQPGLIPALESELAKEFGEPVSISYYTYTGEESNKQENE